MKLNLTPRAALLLLLLSGLAFGQSKKAPKLAISETNYNAGVIRLGTVVSHTFKVKNDGNADLEIKSVAPSCGCTVSDFDKVIPPGQVGKIKLDIHLSSTGAFSKTADVITNDPEHPGLTLVVNFVIESDIKPVGPRVGDFIVLPANRLSGRAARGSSLNLAMGLYKDGARPVRLTKLIPNGNIFTLKLETVEEGKRYMITATSSPSLPIGVHRQTVQLVTDDPAQPELPLQLEVIVTAPILSSPKVITFTNVPLADEEADANANDKFVAVQLIKGAGLELKKITATLPFVTFEVAPESPGQSYLVRVGIDRAKLTKGKHEGEIKIETNNQDLPVIEIPITVSSKP